MFYISKIGHLLGTTAIVLRGLEFYYLCIILAFETTI